VCITDLVTHICTESARVMHGTVHENNWVFYHDALQLMTTKSTIEWMAEQNYLDRWLLPVEGLNDGTRYQGRPIGNSSELMPLDTSLNKDIHDAFTRHRALTVHLPHDHPAIFSSATPADLERGYLQLLDPALGDEMGVPSSKRIVEDILKCTGSHLDQIVDAKGTCVEGLGDRNGVRNVPTGIGRGGLCVKKLRLSSRVTLPAVAEVRRAQIEESVALARF